MAVGRYTTPLPFREFACIGSIRAAHPRRVLRLRSLRLSPNPGRRGIISHCLVLGGARKAPRPVTKSLTAFLNSPYEVGALYKTNCDTFLCSMTASRSSPNLPSLLNAALSKPRSITFNDASKSSSSDLVVTASRMFPSGSGTESKRSSKALLTAW